MTERDLLENPFPRRLENIILILHLLLACRRSKYLKVAAAWAWGPACHVVLRCAVLFARSVRSGF